MKTTTPDKPKADKPKDVRSDQRYIAAQGNFDRIQQQRSALADRIGGLESRLAEPQTLSRQAGLDQAALRVLDAGEAPSPVMPDRNLAAELSEARRQLIILDHAAELAGRRVDEAAAEISVELLPAIKEENRRHNREALELDVQRAHQYAQHESFLAAHERDGVRGLPGIEWPSSLGILQDPYSLIRGRCREALELGIISESELRDLLEGQNL